MQQPFQSQNDPQQPYQAPQGQPPYHQQHDQNQPVVPQPGLPRGRGCSTPAIMGTIFLTFALIGCIIFAAASFLRTPATIARQTAAPQATPGTTPTSLPQIFKTTHAFKGEGNKKTGVFTVPGEWKILWTCNPASFFGTAYNVIIAVYASDATLVDVAINAICKKGATSGETEEHTSGSVYLAVSSEGSWSVQIQEVPS